MSWAQPQTYFKYLKQSFLTASIGQIIRSGRDRLTEMEGLSWQKSVEYRSEVIFWSLDANMCGVRETYLWTESEPRTLRDLCCKLNDNRVKSFKVGHLKFISKVLETIRKTWTAFGQLTFSILAWDIDGDTDFHTMRIPWTRSRECIAAEHFFDWIEFSFVYVWSSTNEDNGVACFEFV